MHTLHSVLQKPESVSLASPHLSWAAPGLAGALLITSRPRQSAEGSATSPLSVGLRARPEEGAAHSP